MRYRSMLLSILCLALIGACSTKDPREALLEDRARWNVEPLDWSPQDDGGVMVSVRVSGPVHSKLTELSFLVDFLDASGQSLGEQWRTIDVSSIERGGPKDMTLRFDPPSGDPAEMTLDLVRAPSPEQEPYVKELLAVTPG